MEFLPLPLRTQPCEPFGASCLFYRYKVGLIIFLNRIMEQCCTPGRNLGGLLEKGGRGWNIFLVFSVISAEGTETKKGSGSATGQKAHSHAPPDPAGLAGGSDCLGVGEASWVKSVVWGNGKQTGLIRIRKRASRWLENDSKLAGRVKVWTVENPENVAHARAYKPHMSSQKLCGLAGEATRPPFACLCCYL